MIIYSWRSETQNLLHKFQLDAIKNVRLFHSICLTIDFPPKLLETLAATTGRTAILKRKSARRSETNAQETEKSICLFVLRHTFHRDLVPGKRAGRIKFQVIGSSSGKVMSVRGVNSITFVRLSSRVSKLSFGASFRECFATTLSNRICTTIQLQGINYFKAKSSAKCRHFQTIPSCWNFAFHEN